MKKLITSLLLLTNGFLFGQKQESIKWFNPKDSKEPIVFNQAWAEELASPYHRLPKRAKKVVRKRVWELSKNSAGLALRFRTNAEHIKVHYKVKGDIEFPHFSMTGVRGLDLYYKSEGQWLRTYDNCSLSNPCRYDYHIDNLEQGKEQEYQLYLPLYEEVLDLKIGVEDGASFEFIKPKRNGKRIVAYGTSICQGACVSRAGLSWANLLGRRLDCELINLGFSGNGKLESEVLDFINELEADLYILDCLPNLEPKEDDVYQLTLDAVHKLRSKHPDTAIILTEHLGYANAQTNKYQADKVVKLNSELRRAFEDLRCSGEKDLYLLRQETLALDDNSFVDYVHPNDHGMLLYAKAYASLIKAVLGL